MRARLISWASVPFVAAMAVVNLGHPFLHHLEGGTLDSVLDYLNAVAAQVASRLPERS